MAEELGTGLQREQHIQRNRGTDLFRKCMWMELEYTAGERTVGGKARKVSMDLPLRLRGWNLVLVRVSSGTLPWLCGALRERPSHQGGA